MSRFAMSFWVPAMTYETIATVPSCDAWVSTGSLSPSIVEQALGELVDRRLRRGWSAFVTTTCERERGALRPLLVHQVERLHAVDRIGERGEVALADVQPQGR